MIQINNYITYGGAHFHFVTSIHDFSLTYGLISFLLKPIFPFPSGEFIFIPLLFSIRTASFILMSYKSFLFSVPVMHP